MVEHGGQPDLLRLDHARASYFLVAHFRGGQELLELFIGGAARAEEPATWANSPVFVLFWPIAELDTVADPFVNVVAQL